jgi:hypothetical protein
MVDDVRDMMTVMTNLCIYKVYIPSITHCTSEAIHDSV